MMIRIKKLEFALVVLAAACMVQVSCKTKFKAGNEQTSVETICSNVREFGTTHPDGFTIDIRDMSEPTEGICVAYAATNGMHELTGLHTVVKHALDHDGYVGGWLNRSDGRYYYDSVKLFSEDEMDKALAFAVENGQEAIYVLSTGTEIQVKQAEAA